MCILTVHYVSIEQLLAVSPGLFGATYPAYTVVQIDPSSGSVTKLFEVTPSGR